jgi:hypothetical protein
MLGAMKTLSLLCLMALAAPVLALAAAEEPVSPSEFRKYAEGHTLYFDRDGAPFGSETFEPGGQTLWRYRDGSCSAGVWRPHGGQVCFYYGEETDVLCWRLIRDDEGLLVRLLGDGPDAGMELRITGRDQRQPICGEPGRGA